VLELIYARGGIATGTATRRWKSGATLKGKGCGIPVDVDHHWPVRLLSVFDHGSADNIITNRRIHIFQLWRTDKAVAECRLRGYFSKYNEGPWTCQRDLTLMKIPL